MISERRLLGHDASHLAGTAVSPFAPPASDTIRVGGRRWFLQTGMAGMAGLTLPALLAANEGRTALLGRPKKSVILFWLSGGPSHIDMWDPKPDAPQEIRSPFATLPTNVPGIHFTEHLPLQASIADKLTVIRSVDCSASNHTPITMQAGNPLARRTDDSRDGAGYPSMGSVVAKFRGANDADLPAFIGLAPSWAADVYGAGNLGNKFEPVKGLELAGKFTLPEGVAVPRLSDRDNLRQQLDKLRHQLDRTATMEQQGRYTQQAYDMVLSGKVQQAFDVTKEKDTLRDEYGRNSVGEKAILARRLVESGVTFVLISGAWGYFDHHGDSVKWGGIVKGLKPALPDVDRALYALVNDLSQRGLLDDTLVMMMGEFGRSPVINKDAGRDHWTSVMSMVMAGGGFSGGRVIGSTDSRGGAIASQAVRPQDLAATTFRHLGIDLSTHWVDPQGRPTPIVVEGGTPIMGLG
ncbi:MAG TPA: DUF1501 domain-containing protein [Pirellulaceae bacterium]|nr:DUF1501 domain-containing protein [Pirellulaceae bacterium]